MVQRAILCGAVVLLFSCSAPAPYSDVQVNSTDHSAPDRANFTTESEPSIARFGSKVVIGYNTTRQAATLGAGGWNSLSGYAWSNDGGATFTDGGFVPPGPYKFLGDPAVAYDAAGHAYYASVGVNNAGFYRVYVSKSTTTTTPVTFGTPEIVYGFFSSDVNVSEDKDAIAVDTSPASPYAGRTYLAWSEMNDPDAQVLFAASYYQAPTWLAMGAAQALSPATGFHHGADIAVGPNGEVYVAWSTISNIVNPSAASIDLVKSTDGGAGFGNPDGSDPNPSKVVASFTSTTDDIGTGGIHVRTRSFPHIAVDRTPAGSPTSGNVYAVFQAKPTASSSPRSEIFFTRSTDGGATWLPARTIGWGSAVTYNGDPTSNDNWLPSIAVSPLTGHIKVVFYSRREDPANQNVRVYEAGSTDGGVTWYGRPFSAVPFQPSTGYDPVLKPFYMGDYLHAFADGSGMLAAWGDARNQCAPPFAAPAPCSPSGRGDQDVWSLRENDVFGPDLFVTPWGYVSAQGPLWQTPDIFVVDSSNNVTVAHKNVHNNLRARVTNIGTGAANDASVQFSFAPSGMGLQSTAFENIGSPVSLSAPAASSPQVVPTDWFLDPNDTNGGAWGGHLVSEFDHFCVHVVVSSASDINVSNNAAYDNFVNVSARALKPMKFLVGNPFDRDVEATVVTDALPAGYAARISDIPEGGKISLKRGEVRLASIALSRPPDYETQRRERDVVANASLVIDGRSVGGISYLIAKANAAPEKRPAPGPIRISSTRPSNVPTAPPEPTPTPVPRVVVAADAAPATRALAELLRSENIPVAAVDEKAGIVSSGSIPLSRSQVAGAVPARFAAILRPEARGYYLLSFATRSTQPGQTEISVSVRIILTSSEIDTALGGRLLPSNGSLERRQLQLLAEHLKVLR
ncbi:MAG: hypothetical protein QOD51_1773 [Candidatus Eremiobacteraeota bacterium]|jgi:hypothetical protein|nr:hypothetical protein [Candidatus Eremiobacteraeota bacterium]